MRKVQKVATVVKKLHQNNAKKTSDKFRRFFENLIDQCCKNGKIVDRRVTPATISRLTGCSKQTAECGASSVSKIPLNVNQKVSTSLLARLYKSMLKLFLAESASTMSSSIITLCLTPTTRFVLPSIRHSTAWDAILTPRSLS